ncbi:MAG: hypothetical protein IJY84_06250 [Clostridia bacterium]|nr:hypothetical protein [Clostridia bacterium]
METFTLNERSVAIDFERGVIAKIISGDEQLNCGFAPLFSVKMRDRIGKSRVIESTKCQFESFSDGVARYTFEQFNIQVLVAVNGDGLRLRANVQNKTADLLEWIELASFSVCEKLGGEEGGKGEIIYPYNEGCIVNNMAYRESMPFKYVEPDYPSKNSFSIFPNMVFAQFIAYKCDKTGVYLGMHDCERTTKHVDFCYYQGGIKVFMRAFCDLSYGEDYQMPFDCVLQFFDGDWYEAVDIYYDWFSKNLPQNLKKIGQNESLPTWHAQSPLIVAYPLRGEFDADITPNGLYPYENALPILDEIAQNTDSKVMALLMHWEGSAPWAPPYSWPPYGGENEFKNFVDKIHNKGNLIGLYTSGFGWTSKSLVDENYKKTDEYESLKISQAVCANSDGKIESRICTAQREGVDFCPAHPLTKAIFKQEFDKICASGIDYLQALDQNHGGNSYFCYSDSHGHPPAPGKWQQKEVNSLLSSIEKRGVVLGAESSAAEPFISQIAFSDNRYELNYYLGEPVPIYAYIYHEYVNNFMGNQICAMLEKKPNNFTYRLAYSFIAGDMLTVVINGKGELLYAWCDYVEPKEQTVDKSTALNFIKTLNAWRNKGGKKFLRGGKMIKPICIKTDKQSFLLEDGKTYLTPNSVLTSAYSFGGERAQFLVNYNLAPMEVELESPCDAYFDVDLKICKKSVNRLIIEPLSVVMLKI